MNNEVSFFTLFKRFEPNEKQRAILALATDIERQINKEQRRVKVRLSLPQTVDKEILYEIEEGIAKAYDLNGVFLMPKIKNALYLLSECLQNLYGKNLREHIFYFRKEFL